MARLIGPDESVRTVYLHSGTNAGKAMAQGLSVPLYVDLALSVPADVRSTTDQTIAGTPPTLTVDAYSQIPLFKYPDGVDTVYTSIQGGPPVPLYARTDDRLDTLTAANTTNVTAIAALQDDLTALDASTDSRLDALTTGADTTSAAVTALETSAAYRNQLPIRGVGGRSAIVTIMVYHAIPSAPNFATDLDYYQEWNYTTVDPDQIADFIDGTGTLPDKPLLITFDDGYLTQYTNAYPALLARGMKATIYITTGWLDGTVNAASVGFTEANALTWAQCVEMFANGIRIQSHTVGHIDQATRTATQVRDDYLAVKARIEQQVPGETVGHMAYPYGSWDDDAKAGLAAAGCRTARVVRVEPRSGQYPGPNKGRYAYALLGLNHRYELPCAGANFADIMQANFNHQLGPDEELIPDMGFEAGGKGWTLGTAHVVDTVDKHSGTRSLQATQQTSSTASTPQRLIPVGMYCRVVGSVWIKTSGLPVGAQAKIQYQIIRSDGSTIYQVVDAVTVTGNNNAWTEYTWSYTGDGNTGYLRMYCWLSGNGTPSGTARYDDLTMKRDVLPSPLALPF